MSKEHTYSNGEVTIIWKPELCIHSTKCWKGLYAVFQPGQRPWIKPHGASTERIIAQVEQCPSGALGYRRTQAMDEERATDAPTFTVEVTGNGPLLVNGPCTITYPDGRTETRDKAAFCRCGGSSTKPYCDGTHRKNGFAG